MLKRIFINLLFILLLTLGISSLINPIYKNGLLKFYSVTKNDPLFYSPDTDIKYLRRTVSNLKRIDNEILAEDRKARKNVKEKNPYPAGWSIWPDNFLATLPEIHEATEAFLKTPTSKNAQNLIVLYDKSAKNYKNSIELHIKTLKTILKTNPKTAQTKIIFLGSATTPQIVLNDFNLILKNAEKLENEIKHRDDCLVKGFCRFEKSEFSERKNSVMIPFKPLADDILGIDRSKTKIFGPYFVQSGCFGLTQNRKSYKYPFYVVENKVENGLIFVKPAMTNTKYYRDYAAISERVPIDLLTADGNIIRPHFETNDYLCTDMRYYPSLIMQYMKDKKLVNKTSDDYLATLPYLIDNTYRFSIYLIYNIKYANKPYSPLYFLVGRSGYSIYFGTFSKSVWRLPDSPQFLINKDFSKYLHESGYLRLEDLLSRGISLNEVKKINSAKDITQVYKDYFKNLEKNPR